ncbi:Molybdopterin molybdenumtransferase [Baekduia alba]|nr:Molybdopterin molybdenumtransferase [Baekduia alba]
MLALARPLGTERIDIDRAIGRRLAGPLRAAVDAPRCPIAAVDGYAIASGARGEGPMVLRVVGSSAPGSKPSADVTDGEAIRILTGAPVPEGAEWVVMQEDVCRHRDSIVISRTPERRHIREQASDFRQGDELLQTGRLLDARALVVAAAADQAAVEVFRRPRVSIVATGSELVSPGTAARSRLAVPDSVSLGVAALAGCWDGDVVDRRRLPDDLARLTAAAGDALGGAEVVVVTGGASVGDVDLAKPMFVPHGLRLVFAKIASKPGKPVWMGRARRRIVVGLPGNPSSALVMARLFLAPLLHGLAGGDPFAALRWRPALLHSPLPAPGPWDRFHRGRMVGDSVCALPNQSSGSQQALAAADVLIRLRAHAPAVPAGGQVEVLDF